MKLNSNRPNGVLMSVFCTTEKLVGVVTDMTDGVAAGMIRALCRP
jgi:hypothetical protein